MTEEEKKAAQEAEQAEFEASLEELSDDEKAEKIAEREAKNNAEPDIEEALKIERARREKAEADLNETRQKAKERFEKSRKEKEVGSGDEGDGDKKPLTKTELREMFDEERETVRKELRVEQAREIANSLAGNNPMKADLILETWKNRNLVGTLHEQMEEAQAIAFRKRTLGENEELKRALANKNGMTNDGANMQRKPMLTQEPKLNPVDKTALAGYTWDSSKNAYKKVIAKGTKVFYVARDLKKRWVENISK